MSDAVSTGNGAAPAHPGAPFTAQLRARQELIRLGADDAATRWTVRVQMPEVWDAVKLSAPPTEPVLSLKMRALEELYPDAPGSGHESFVLKLGGIEVLDESAPLGETGAADGSIFLLTYRRRRPVR